MMNMPGPDVDSSYVWQRAMTGDEFFGVDPHRRDSARRGYGVTWHQLDQPLVPIEVIYFVETEEVVAIRGGGDYLLLATLPRAELDKKLRGWADVHNSHRNNSFEWVLGCLGVV
jgi:hypothetical protein